MSIPGDVFTYIHFTNWCVTAVIAIVCVVRVRNWQQIGVASLLLIQWIGYNYFQVLGLFGPGKLMAFELVLSVFALWWWVHYQNWLFGFLATVLGVRVVWHGLHYLIGFDPMVYANVNGLSYFFENTVCQVMCVLQATLKWGLRST